MLQAEVGCDETVAAVDTNSGTDEHAINVDDVGLQHRECLPNEGGQSAAKAAAKSLLVSYIGGAGIACTSVSQSAGPWRPFLARQSRDRQRSGSSTIRVYSSPEAQYAAPEKNNILSSSANRPVWFRVSGLANGPILWIATNLCPPINAAAVLTNALPARDETGPTEEGDRDA